MIDLYFWPTPNGYKAAIMLAESGLDYRVIPVDITAGEQFHPEFLSKPHQPHPLFKGFIAAAHRKAHQKAL